MIADRPMATSTSPSKQGPKSAPEAHAFGFMAEDSASTRSSIPSSAQHARRPKEPPRRPKPPPALRGQAPPNRRGAKKPQINPQKLLMTMKPIPVQGPTAGATTQLIVEQNIWADNLEFWKDKNCPLAQEIIFASTGTKKPEDPPTKYVDALAGSDIQTNPPATNDAAAQSGMTFTKKIDQLPSPDILGEIFKVVDFEHLEETLMREGIEKFAVPQHALLDLVAEKGRDFAQT